MHMGRSIELAAADGHRLAAYDVAPSGSARGAVVLAPEIFGVNDYIRSVADSYAADGYLTVAPALFDRVRRDYEAGYAPEDVQAGIGLMQQVSMDDAMRDVAAAVEHAARGGGGAVGIVGFCWGGTVAWLAAARVPGLACAVSHYPGRIGNYKREQPRCPVLLQFGEHDHNPAPEQARDVVAAHPGVEHHFYPAGHGFACDRRGSYDAASAQSARMRTMAFLAAHVG